jgi:YD repeat-containing protein
MKLILRVILAVSAIGLFGGCSKIADVLRHPGEFQHLCKLEKFYLNYYDHTTGLPGTPVEYDIFYNAKGNPIEIKPADFNNTFGFITWFVYDKKDRLIDYRLDVFHSPTDTGIIYVHHYYYAPGGRMIVDSEYQLPPANPMGQESPQVLHKLSLDPEGRVIKDTTGFPVGNSFIVNYTIDYTYDAKGNLVGPVYDDKVNWQQTNSVWQLINRDYSRNNKIDTTGLFTITGYNAYGLPLQYVYVPMPPQYNSPGAILLMGSPYAFNIANLQYSCDVPGGPGK